MAYRSGGGDDSETNPLLRHHQITEDKDDVVINNHNHAPISGQVPSPNSGIHTLLPDGINHTITTNNSSDHAQLRHRHHRSSPPTNSNQQQQQSQSWDIYGRHSLDDADIAGGAFRMPLPTNNNRLSSSATSPVSNNTTRSRSFGGSSSSSTRKSTPPSNYNDTINRRQSLTPLSGRLQSSNEHHLLQQHHHQQNQQYRRSNEIDRGRQSVYYAGSEHDFLRLSMHDNEQGRKILPPVPNITSDRFTTPGRFNITNQSSSKTNSSTFIVLGINLTSYSPRIQFLISAFGSFVFSLLYGYLQELISVELCSRKLGLFLALMQFMGYTILSYFFRKFGRIDADGNKNVDEKRRLSVSSGSAAMGSGSSSSSQQQQSITAMIRRVRKRLQYGRTKTSDEDDEATSMSTSTTVPIELYIGLSILRAIDLGMTNLAMQYVNYPTKTLMKSTRVVFTMIFGVVITRKRYVMADYSIVMLMVVGLCMFLHADTQTSAVFAPMGIIMLIISLLCDGAISNLSEALMNQYSVGQDEFIFRLYSIATFFIFIAAAIKGDLHDGIAYLTRPGTIQEMEDGLLLDNTTSWSISGKALTMILFSTTGYLSSSCSAAITKTFGALAMSITSTARKATTIFLSFALFPSNECTVEHVGGILLFITSLIVKSLRASKRHTANGNYQQQHQNYRYCYDNNNNISPMKDKGKGGNGMTNVGGNERVLELNTSPLLHYRRRSNGEDNDVV